MKRLSSFAVINIDGGDRISFTYDEINDETGEPISKNNKQNFYVVNADLQSAIDDIKDYIRENKLQ